jgi:hypothetical protein
MPLANIVCFIKLFEGVHFPLYYQHGWHVERVSLLNHLQARGRLIH